MTTQNPYAETEAVSKTLMAEVAGALKDLEVSAWSPLQNQLHQMDAETNTTVDRLSHLREDTSTPLGARLASFDGELTGMKAKAGRYRDAAHVLVNVIKAELETGALPKVGEREQFIRQDLAGLLQGATGLDLSRRLMDIAGGPNRQQAALVLGDFGRPYLQQAYSDKQARDKFAAVLVNAGLDGSIRHGNETERRFAQAAKSVPTKVARLVDTRVVPALTRLKDLESTRP